MKRVNSEAGSHLIALALFILFVGVVGFAGYQVWQRQQPGTVASTTTGASVPSKITNTATLDQATAALDSASSQVNTSLDDSGLNSDLSDLL